MPSSSPRIPTPAASARSEVYRAVPSRVSGWLREASAGIGEMRTAILPVVRGGDASASSLASIRAKQSLVGTAKLCFRTAVEADPVLLKRQKVARNAREVDELAARVPATIHGAAAIFIAQLVGSPQSVKDVAKQVGIAESAIKVLYRLLLLHHGRMLDAERAAGFDVAGMADLPV
ncbi:transcription initiation factor IIB [Blastocladiella emersonii ATCC 22665]|nr:transcription initiation factor IIB [Blastocladiella emersonii ATCC 22665]